MSFRRRRRRPRKYPMGPRLLMGPSRPVVPGLLDSAGVWVVSIPYRYYRRPGLGLVVGDVVCWFLPGILQGRVRMLRVVR